MADFATNTPYVPYNPMQGLQTLQGVLGIKAQQLEIQKAQQDVQTAQATAQQAQQKNRELQGLAQFTQKATQDPAYKMPDGSPNIAKFQNDASAVAPIYGQDAIGRYTENFRSAVNTRKDLQALSSDQNKALSGFFQSVAGMENPTHDDILNAAGQARANNTDPGFNRALDRALMNFDPSLGPKDIRKRAGVAANTLGGMTGVTPTMVDTGAGIQGATTNNYTGAITPAGQPVQKQLGPTDQPAYKATVSNIPEDTQRFSQISNENQKGQSMVALANRVSELADQVRTGKLSKEWTDRLAVLNQESPGLTARQMLGKYAAQLKTMAESGASTDAERGQIEAGMPNPDTMAPGAVKEAAQYVGGMGAMRKARNDVASAYVQKNGTNGIRAVDDQFMQHADPFVYMYRNLPQGQERQQFLLKQFGDGKRITDKAGLQRFLDQQNVVKHYGG
jgi:uncharacterized protein YdbL (DUF1318 family)